MTIQVAAMFGVSLTKANAEGVMAACASKLMGAAIFESLNLAYPVTIPAKIAIAVGTFEAVGNAVYSYYEQQTKKKPEVNQKYLHSEFHQVPVQ